jgi:hypothetical protein
MSNDSIFHLLVFAFCLLQLMRNIWTTAPSIVFDIFMVGVAIAMIPCLLGVL